MKEGNNFYKVLNKLLILEDDNEPWWVTLYSIISYSALFFAVLPLMFRGHETWMDVCDYGSCSFFILDYLLRGILFVHRYPGNILKAIIHYPVSGAWPIIDLISIIPTFAFLIPNQLKMARLMRLLKLSRLAKSARNSNNNIYLLIQVVKRQQRLLGSVCMIAGLYILVVALLMFNMEQGINPATGELIFKNFFEAIYWSCCTLTTVGFGDFCPVSFVGRSICMISSLIGVAIIALPSSIITAAYQEELRKKQEKKEVMKGKE